VTIPADLAHISVGFRRLDPVPLEAVTVYRTATFVIRAAQIFCVWGQQEDLIARGEIESVLSYQDHARSDKAWAEIEERSIDRGPGGPAGGGRQA